MDASQCCRTQPHPSLIQAKPSTSFTFRYIASIKSFASASYIRRHKSTFRFSTFTLPVLALATFILLTAKGVIHTIHAVHAIHAILAISALMKSFTTSSSATRLGFKYDAIWPAALFVCAVSPAAQCTMQCTRRRPRAARE